ncbi:MAG: L,D-transpeptidase family protein [Clostridiales bacterium]|nr:L,D-transpeptidase family protein [Clostridiales bacterium]
MKKAFIVILIIAILATTLTGCRLPFSKKDKDEKLHADLEQEEDQQEQDEKEEEDIPEIELVTEEEEDVGEIEVLDEDEEEEEESEEEPEEEEQEKKEEKEEKAPKKPLPYKLEIDVTNQVVTAYSRDSSGNYTKIARQMICTTGKSSTPTPLGTFKMPGQKGRWGYFTKFDTYAQYWNRIRGSILFHSVLFAEPDVSTISMSSVRNLGSPASHGCVRLTVADAKWLYESCPAGTEVTVLKKKKNSALTNKLKASMPAHSMVKLALESNTTAVESGKKEDIVLNATYDNGKVVNKAKDAKWSISDTNIATIKDGKVSGLKEGTTGFTASFGGRNVKGSIKVLPPPPPKPELAFETSDDTIVLKTKKEHSLKLLYRPDKGEKQENVTDKAKWESSDENIIKVDKGKITAGELGGSATITAKYEKLTVKIKVNVEAEEQLIVEPASMTLDIKAKENAKLTFIDSSSKKHIVTDKAEGWKSSDEKIAKVDKKGNITAIAAGEATITASYKGLSAKLKVVVNAPPKPTVKDVVIENNLTEPMTVGQEQKITLTAEYSDGSKKVISSKDVSWASSNKEVATIDANGNIKAKSAGNVTISAKYKDITKEIKIEIKAKEEELPKNDKDDSEGGKGDNENSSGAGTDNDVNKNDTNKSDEEESKD